VAAKPALKLVPAAIAIAAVAGTWTVDAAGRDQRVRHGEGIGRLHLGMTVAEARRVLGPPEAVARREPRSGGRVYVEYQWGFATWAVGFVGKPGQLRAIRVSTVKRSERTPEGLGVGSTTAQLERRLRPLDCHDFVVPGNNPIPLVECVHRLPTGRQTVFMVERYNTKVAIVEVRARGCDFYGRNCRAR
jgi:hypothetical protein